jgi:hypothetical protein
MISLRRPWYRKTWLKNNLVVPLLISILVHRMKWAIFIKRSTTTKMESKELEGGRSMMKSMEIKEHEDARINNGWRRPWGQWQRLFVRTQTLQDLANSFTYFQSYGYQQCWDTNSMVLLNPKWPTSKVLCLTWKTWSYAIPLRTYKKSSW